MIGPLVIPPGTAPCIRCNHWTLNTTDAGWPVEEPKIILRLPLCDECRMWLENDIKFSSSFNQISPMH